MPLYTYECERGHTTEVRAGYDDDRITCPACGRSAQRTPFYRGQTLITETGAGSGYGMPHKSEALDANGRYAVSRLQEAQAEIAYAHEKKEERAGRELPRRNLVREGLKRGLAHG